MVITRQLTDSASASTASGIQLGSCVTEIGQGAFSGYTNITDVEFPDSLTTIGVGAFNGSSITSVEFPDNLETIGDSAFGECYGLRTVDIPDSVTTIGNYAFNFSLVGVSLTECTIGSGVTSIGQGAFRGSTDMRKLTIKATTPPTLGNNALDGNYLIYVPYDSYNDYITATDWVNYKSRIVYIDFPYKAMFLNATGGSENFVPCNESFALTRDEVVNTITTAVTKVTLGNCINTVGNNNGSVFSGYTSLNEIEFSDSITAITDSAFANTNAHITTLPSSVATIGGDAFRGISFDSLTIGNNITSIGYSAFEYCNIGTLNLASTATTYPRRYGVFSNANITNLNIGNTVTKIPASMFESSSGFTSLTIPNSVATIENYGFYKCDDLKTLTINGNTAIGNRAFSICSSLSSVTMPNVTEIGTSAFNDCSSLKKINPSSTYDAVINLSAIKDWAFYGNAFETLELGANVTSVRGESFANNTNLKKLHIIGNNSTIFDVEVASSPVSYHGAFENCTALEEVIIDNAYSFNNRDRVVNAFSNCNAIKKITIGSGYSSIDNYLFQGSTNLTSLTLSNGITSIGECSFSGCTNLPTLVLPSTLQSIGANAFTNCSSITTLIIPDSVVSIGNQAFSGCSGLNSILIGRSTPPTIGTNVFAGSSCLIYVPQASYDLYVNAENWSLYRDRIFATGVDYKAILIGGTNKVINCNNNTTLSLSEIGSNNAETINIGNCVTAIGESVFTNSKNIQTVSISSGVTSIGNRAFDNRRTLTTVSGLQGVVTIGDYAFRGTSLTTIVVPSGVTSIGSGAFQSSTLTSVTFDGLTPPTLGNYSHSGSYSLVSNKIPIYVPCAAYDSYMTAWASTSTSPITDYLVPYGQYEKDEEVVGEYICDNGNKYKKIAHYVSSDNTNWCLQGYVNGDLIEESASDCGTFLHVEWDRICGTNCNVSGYSYTKLCGEATSTTVTSSDIPYSKNYVTAITVGDCVTEIDQYTFNIGFLSSITLSNSITTIGENAFSGAKIQTIDLPDGLTTIESGLFQSCIKLTSISIPSGVTSIGNYAFSSCSGLTSIDIPSGVTNIGDYAFRDCSGLTSVTVNATTPPTLRIFSSSSYAFSNTNNCPIYVPSDSVDTYKTTRGWSSYASRIQAIPNS